MAALLGVSLAIPDHTTFSRRSAGLSLVTPLSQTAEPVGFVAKFKQHAKRDEFGWELYES